MVRASGTRCRCKFCGTSTNNPGGFCRECFREGFVTVYYMTGGRSNGWEWIERNQASMRVRAKLLEKPREVHTQLISDHVRRLAV